MNAKKSRCWGRALRYARESRDIPLKMIAADLGMPYSTYQHLENGKTRISMDMAYAICKYMKWDLNSWSALANQIGDTNGSKNEF